MNVILFYIGCGGLVISGLCQIFDENDRFFTPQITEIDLSTIGICLGVGFIGLFGSTNISVGSSIIPLVSVTGIAVWVT